EVVRIAVTAGLSATTREAESEREVRHVAHGSSDERRPPPVPAVTAHPQRCAVGERRTAGSVRDVSWMWWLAPPVVATIVASIGSWFRARPAPVPDTAAAMQAHSDYLAALANGA